MAITITRYEVAILMLTMMQMVGLSLVSGGSLSQQCTTVIQPVMSCLSFATGKENEPTKECCDTVTNMREKQPVCLCYFIGQAHNGSQEFKSLGIQEPKLLQLPSACHLTNAKVSDCPKLLGISPTSPAAAIFMNNATAPTTSASSTSNPSPDKSTGFKLEINGVLGGIFLIFVSMLFSVNS